MPVTFLRCVAVREVREAVCLFWAARLIINQHIKILDNQTKTINLLSVFLVVLHMAGAFALATPAQASSDPDKITLSDYSEKLVYWEGFDKPTGIEIAFTIDIPFKDKFIVFKPPVLIKNPLPKNADKEDDGKFARKRYRDSLMSWSAFINREGRSNLPDKLASMKSLAANRLPYINRWPTWQETNQAGFSKEIFTGQFYHSFGQEKIEARYIFHPGYLHSYTDGYKRICLNSHTSNLWKKANSNLDKTKAGTGEGRAQIVQKKKLTEREKGIAADINKLAPERLGYADTDGEHCPLKIDQICYRDAAEYYEKQFLIEHGDQVSALFSYERGEKRDFSFRSLVGFLSPHGGGHLDLLPLDLSDDLTKLLAENSMLNRQPHLWEEIHKQLMPSRLVQKGYVYCEDQPQSFTICFCKP